MYMDHRSIKISNITMAPSSCSTPSNPTHDDRILGISSYHPSLTLTAAGLQSLQRRSSLLSVRVPLGRRRGDSISNLLHRHRLASPQNPQNHLFDLSIFGVDISHQRSSRRSTVQIIDDALLLSSSGNMPPQEGADDDDDETDTTGKTALQ